MEGRNPPPQPKPHEGARLSPRGELYLLPIEGKLPLGWQPATQPLKFLNILCANARNATKINNIEKNYENDAFSLIQLFKNVKKILELYPFLQNVEFFVVLRCVQCFKGSYCFEIGAFRISTVLPPLGVVRKIFKRSGRPCYVRLKTVKPF